MFLLRAALRNPITVLVTVLTVFFFSFLAIKKMKIDIFPDLGIPVIYIAQPYGGLSPEQMEGFITNYYETMMVYVSGVKSIESKSVQGVSLIKIQFQEGVDMSEAMSEVLSDVNRARTFMPVGTPTPFLLRFDAGSLPLGKLVFSSNTYTLGEIQDIALFRVRPIFATLPGVSSPPPFGGNQKTVVVNVDPERIRGYNLSPDDVVQELAKANSVLPAGNIRVGDQTLITAQNAVVENVKELENVPIRKGIGSAVYLRDIAHVSIGSDVTTSFALVNGHKSIYIPVTKRASSSTWDVVQLVKKSIPELQAAIPDGIKVSFEFDQSGYVVNAVRSVLSETITGAILTGLMVLLFLGNLRSSLIVVLTIPLALLTSVILLSITGQTINIMTLGGLALAVGILVDMATVTVESIHQNMQKGLTKSQAIWKGCKDVASPKMLIMFCILSIFAPAMFMTGVPKGMFLPLALAVGFSVIAAFIFALSFVPVMANWILDYDPDKEMAKESNLRFERFKVRYLDWLRRFISVGQWKTVAYVCVSAILGGTMFVLIGKELFPKVDADQAQFRIRMPLGTRLERTEEATQKMLKIADSITNHQVDASSAFVGTQPSTYPTNTIYLFTRGPNESVVNIALKKKSGIPIEEFKERLRAAVKAEMPDATISFEPGDLVEAVLDLGTDTPIEVAVVGRDLSKTRKIATDLLAKMKGIDFLRDQIIATPLDYPVIKMNIDRVKAGQMGMTTEQVARSMVAATSSSRFTQINYWLDKNSGVSYQVQVQYPEYKMNHAEELLLVPLNSSVESPVLVRDVATLSKTTMPGEFERLNLQRYIAITANIHGKDLGGAITIVKKAIAALGELPKGVKIIIKGQSPLLDETQAELRFGLLVAIVVILLMLTVFFQSFRLSMAILSIVPSVLFGSLFLLWASGHTLNIQSYMGSIMAIAVAVSNAILYVTNAERYRKDHQETPALSGASHRLRPILMTTLAMIVGMIPLAIGIGEGGEQTAPLGVAVIGGLLLSTISTLVFLPMIYTQMAGKKAYVHPSLDPNDPRSTFYENPSQS